ncbi:MAG: hypothetical protein LH606_07760 [Cytophagaceae bacterium]|nr:hypothetical protein [Cytophagaceae bacterium]
MLKQISAFRMALGLGIMTVGQQSIFFVKERLHQGAAFTAACLILGLVLMLPKGFLTRYFPNNSLLMGFVVSWIAVAFLYMYVNITPFGRQSLDMFRENSNYIAAIAFLVTLLNVPETVRRPFILVVVLITCFSSLLLFYSLLTNPNYIYGMRATIFYGDGESGGNPHVAARNGFAGLIASVILIKRHNLLLKSLAYFNICLSLVSIVLAQSRMMLLSLMIVAVLFLFFNLRPRTLSQAGKSLAKPSSLFFYSAIVIGTYFLVVTTPVLDLLVNYATSFWNSFLDAMGTVAGTSEKGDASASNRVTSFGFFREVAVGSPGTLFLGAGYKQFYFDVPILEAFYDCGILGFLTFGGFLVVCTWECYKVMRRPADDMSNFLVYFFVPTFIQAFTGGRPFDTSFLFIFAMYVRFLNADATRTQNQRATVRQPISQPA